MSSASDFRSSDAGISEAAGSGVFKLPRPHWHSLQHVLRYHLRGGDSRSERAVENGFVKAMVLQGTPVEVEIRQQGDAYTVRSSSEQAIAPGAVRTVAERLLALTPEPTMFAARFEDDPLLGSLISRRPGLLIPQLATPFEALTWAITGQQISFAVAYRIRRALIELAARTTPGGMLAFPDAAAVAAVGLEGLRSCGYSRNKARALSELADDIVSEQLVLPETLGSNVDLWRARLLERFGFGPWTVEYALLRGWGYPDADLIGDVVVRRALMVIPERHGISRRRSLSAYKPWRSFAACHLWAEMASVE